MGGIRIKAVAIFYSLLAFAGWWFADTPLVSFVFPPDMWGGDGPWMRAGSGLLIGWLAGRGVVVATRLAVRRFRWAQDMHVEFRGLLGALRSDEILWLALFSAVGEEFLFRGWLFPSLGWFTSSLLFGALHLGPNRRFWPWPLEAFAMGAVFAALMWLSGTLLAPIAAHLTINYGNLHFINAYDPSEHLPRTLSASQRMRAVNGKKPVQ